MSPPTLVGRERELALLDNLLGERGAVALLPSFVAERARVTRVEELKVP